MTTALGDAALVDTGFWIALFDERDSQHRDVGQKQDLLELVTLVVPWPLLYEIIRTRFARHREWIMQFDRILKRPNVEFIDDRAYREDAYALAVEYATRPRRRPISMVDMLCRLLIEDPSIRIDYLLTTNPQDFDDVCRAHGVELL